MKYSVVVVDDHTLLSQAIEGMVNTFDKFKVLYTCKNGKEVEEKFSASPRNIPDLVLVDVNMPVMNGIETTEWIWKIIHKCMLWPYPLKMPMALF